MARSPQKFNAADSFNELFKAPHGERAVTGLKLIERSRIQVQSQPRRAFPEAEQAELVTSIRELRTRGEGIEGTGLLQPLVVTPIEDGYRLIAGERRLRAAGDANLSEVPAIIIQAKAENVRLLQIIENLQRQNLRPLDEARAIQDLMREQNLSVRSSAALLGKNKGYVENRLNLLKMGSDLHELVSVRTDTLQHARLIEPVKDEPLRAKLIQATREGASEREVRQLIEKSATPTQVGRNSLSVRTDSDGKSSTKSRHPTPPDPIADVIKPGVAQIAEGVRLLESGKMDTRRRRALLREIKTAETLVNRLKELAAQ